MRPPGAAQQLERRRRQAVALVEQGCGIRQAATQVGASPGSVSQWWRVYRGQGRAGLAAKPHRGRPSRLAGPQVKRLEKLLLRGPRRQGYATELWTLSRVAEVIEKYFGVTYDPSGVWHVLARMGWSCQKPERRARERDEDAIAAWRKRDWHA